MQWACGVVIKVVPVPRSCLKHLNLPIFGQHRISWQTGHDTITSVPQFFSLSFLSFSVSCEHQPFPSTLTCVLSYIGWHLLLFGFGLIECLSIVKHLVMLHKRAFQELKRSSGIDEKRHAPQECEWLNSKPKSRNWRKQAREFGEGADRTLETAALLYHGDGDLRKDTEGSSNWTCVLSVIPLSSFKWRVLEKHAILYEI